MHVRHIDVLDEVLVTGRASLHSDSSSVLETVFGEGCPLDVSEVRDGDDHILICIEVFRIEFLCRKSDLRTSLVSVLLLHLHGLILDDSHLESLVGKHILTVGDELHELVIFALKLFSFESCELTQTHLDDCRGLSL